MGIGHNDHSANGKFRDEYILKMLDLCSRGYTEKQVADRFGVNYTTLVSWKNKHPLLQQAADRGRAMWKNTKQEADASLEGFLYDHLPPKLLRMWEHLQECLEFEGGAEAMEQILEDGGERARQRLFLFALKRYNYHVAKAMKAVNIRRSVVRRWCREDPDFMEMLDEVQELKKDFFENKLLQLVARGDGPATIFVNRTLNADRGYGTSTELNVSGRVDHAHAHINLEDLDLPLEVRKQVMHAMLEHDPTTLDPPVELDDD